jgi:hypothetical protein
MRRGTIGVLLHARDTRFTSFKYVLGPMLKEWERMGFEIQVIRGTRRFVPADLMICHVDLTVVPEAYREFLARYPVVVNRNLVDISKSVVSANLLAAMDEYSGPVIVKSDLNANGLPEQRLLSNRWHASLPLRALRKVVRRLRASDNAAGNGYPVFPSLAVVPRQVFADRTLIVERFLPEVDGDTYHVRVLYCFGDREFNIVLRSKDRNVKGENCFDCSEAPAPPDLRRIRERFRCDYGKIDYVLRNGQVVVFDVNRTPMIYALTPGGLEAKATRHLAGGIWSILNGTSSHPKEARDA